MARVLSIGCIATIDHLAEALDPDPDAIYIHLRPFAKLDDGQLVIDPAPTDAVGMGRDNVRSLPTTVELALGVVVGATAPAANRKAHWGGIVEVLQKQFGISTDPETLMTLPFSLLPDDELRVLINASS